MLLRVLGRDAGGDVGGEHASWASDALPVAKDTASRWADDDALSVAARGLGAIQELRAEGKTDDRRILAWPCTPVVLRPFFNVWVSF